MTPIRHADQLFTRILPVVQQHLPQGVSARDLDDFLARWRPELTHALASGLAARARQQMPSPAERLNANVAAMTLAAGKPTGKLSASQRRVLAGYSGWGGLSLQRAARHFTALPDTFPRPEKRGLIHEYYTPSVVAEAVAEAVAPLVRWLPGDAETGKVLALEPSAGIGRFLRAFEGAAFSELSWQAVEWSALSARMLAALYPKLALFHGPFESWVRERGDELQGRLGLVVSNPPYGPRGAAVAEDPVRAYREKAAYAYFLRRSLDLLAPNGLGVFLVPAGFLTGRSKRLVALRNKVLLRHHLTAAFRLPSVGTDGREALFPGAMLVTDLLFFRSRGGELDDVAEGDRFVLEGRYYQQFPEHILGQELGRESGEDDQTARPRFGYQVQGEFLGLPALVERPFCATCPTPQSTPTSAARAEKATPTRRVGLVAESAAQSPVPEGASDEVRAAGLLGRRVARFLGEVAGSMARVSLWKELHDALNAWVTGYGNPHHHRGLKKALKDSEALQRFLGAFTPKGALITGLRSRPTYEAAYSGGLDLPAMARHLFATHRQLSIETLKAFWIQYGGRGEVDLTKLVRAGWCLDGAGWDQLLPEAVYLTGHLWPRLDHARAQVSRGGLNAQAQVDKLLKVIGPVTLEDIQFSPRDGWVPLEMVQAWLSEGLAGGYKLPALVRKEGLVQFEGIDYEQHASSRRPEISWFIGWLNHDATLFKPSYRRNAGETIDQKRVEFARKWEAAFRAWVEADEDRRGRLEQVYNRQFRGVVAPEFSSEPLDIARWNTTRIRPHPHQNAAARRLVENRGGLLAFDVGVGKTYTGLAVVARARQEGWCRRPVIVVPNSIVWKWAADVQRVLPDYRFAVIGSKRKVIGRGARKGQVTSETDTPAERAAKWTRFQAGEYDLVLMTYTALARSRVNEKDLLAYTQKVEAIQREIRLRQRNARRSKKLTERQEAVMEEGVAAWLAEKLELPKGWAYDPGIVWDELGVDLMVVDEAQNFKNLYLPEAREGGVPRFMGNAGEGSKRAWQMDFRCAAVRRKTGGAGVVLLSATPAKNSPLEFYNLLQMVDPAVFTRMGIRDPEQFIDRYLKVELRQVVDSKMDVVEKGAVVGFKNLHELRDVLHRYAEFKTAEDVGLKLPEPTVQVIEVAMNARQEAKYDRYVAQIQDALDNPDPTAKTAILGLLTRMALVAIHPDLDEGYNWKTAAKAGVDPASPKFAALAKRVLANRGCGHIVFVDNVAAHRWVLQVLVKAGIPEERIAVLNARTASPADRQRIARQFNGVPEEGVEARYDVVIANAVAYEGIDLQTRTCAIHHLDLPWEPATLQQRNGRGVRQGNTLSAIEINYYFALRSSDGLRFNLIQGKRGWMVSLLKSQDRDTNNPGAQQDLGPEEALLLISRDPEKTRQRLDALKAKRAEEARQKLAAGASQLVRGAERLFRKAERSEDALEAGRLRQEAEARLKELDKVGADAWPWHPWAWKARDQTVLHAQDGLSPIFYEGLRAGYPTSLVSDQREFVAFGRVQQGPDGPRIGVRQAGTARWKGLGLEDLARLGALGERASLLPEHLDPKDWPTDDLQRADDELPRLIRQQLGWAGDWPRLGWHLAPEAWVERAWQQFGSLVLRKLASVSQWYARAHHVPALQGEQLRIVRGAELGAVQALPPGDAGWQRFLELAPASGLKFGELEAAGLWWWQRRIPRDLLSRSRSPQAA